MSEPEGKGEFDFDRIEFWRCPQLGGPVTFKYCRIMNAGLPCPRIVACWGGTVDVLAYLTAAFPERSLEELLAGGSKSRLERVLETLDKVSRPPEQKED